MAKTRDRPAYRCAECGHTPPRWVGRCGECQAWGTVDRGRRGPVGLRRDRRRAAGAVTTPARPIGRGRRRGRPGPAHRRATSSTGCSAAGSCPAPCSCWPASPASASPPCCWRWPALRGRAAPSLVRHRRGVGRPGAAAGRAHRRPAPTSSTWPPRPTSPRCSATSTPSHPRCSSSTRCRPSPSPRWRAAPGGVTQVRAVAAALIAAAKERRHRHRPGRPRHQGRRDRRAAGARAPGRRRAAVRGRPALQAAPGPGHEEPVRAGRRGRLLRARRRAASSGWPTRPGCSSTRRDRAGARHLRDRHRWRAAARCWPRCRRWSRRSTLASRRGEPSAGWTRPGWRWCSPCSSSAGGSALGADDVFAATVGGVRLTEPAADLAAGAGGRVGAPGTRRSRRDRWRSARSAWPARFAGSAASSRRLAEAARLGFTAVPLVPPDSGPLPATACGSSRWPIWARRCGRCRH